MNNVNIGHHYFDMQDTKTSDFLSRDETAIDSDIRKNSDSELEVHSTKKRTKVVRRESSRRDCL